MLFCNRTSKDLGVLVRRISENLKIFLPLEWVAIIMQKNATKFW